MKGKATFTQHEADFVRAILEQLRQSKPDQQKKLRDDLRNMGFYISDFTNSSRGFTAEDFDELVQRGTIMIGA